MTFDVQPTSLESVVTIIGTTLPDSRGEFERLYSHDFFADFMGGRPVVQMNRTLTARRGTVRGLHCQLPPSAETKLVRCIRGSAYDVVVDLRNDSRTFGQWWAIELSESEPRWVVVPRGCAHGLQTLSDDVEMLYLHSDSYSPNLEAGVNPRCKELAIAWPLAVDGLSPRDAAERRTVSSFRQVSW